ncbi:MAG: hypothetical protein DHS20C19_13790 [Acidimicrobiales bacterium]|nr:MAG: hypothetical protein DHS20C19_13790 [Acidimicrobiales bacterium]
MRSVKDGRSRTRRVCALALALTSLLATACDVHVVGDSTAYQVGDVVEQFDGSHNAHLGCGFTDVPAGTYRVLPNGAGAYEPCTIPFGDMTGIDNDDYVVAFVSIHDAFCEAPVQNPTPAQVDCSFQTDGYVAAQAAWDAAGVDVIWVQLPPYQPGPTGDPHPYAAEMNSRIPWFNLAVQIELGCDLVPSNLRTDPHPDHGQLFLEGLHYYDDGALAEALGLPPEASQGSFNAAAVVAARVADLDPADHAC